MERGKFYKYDGQRVFLNDAVELADGTTSITYSECFVSGPVKRVIIKTVELKTLFIPENVNQNIVAIEEKEKDTFRDMREILFDTMRKVKDGTLDVKKAAAISSVSQSIIASVKVEIDFARLTGGVQKPKAID